MGRPLKEHDLVDRGDGQMVSRDFKQPVVRCRLCHDCWTESVETRLCDGCWELEHRIQMDPVLARKVLQEMDAKEGR